MKKLIKTTMPVLFLLSLIFSACEKPAVNNPQPVKPNNGAFSINYKWTPKGVGEKQKSGSGDITNGETTVRFQLDPIPWGGNCCQGGKWAVYVTPPYNNAIYIKDQDAKTGQVGFVAHTAGTYQVMITFTCPDGTSYVSTISITVK